MTSLSEINLGIQTIPPLLKTAIFEVSEMAKKNTISNIEQRMNEPGCGVVVRDRIIDDRDRILRTLMQGATAEQIIKVIKIANELECPLTESLCRGIFFEDRYDGEKSPIPILCQKAWICGGLKLALFKSAGQYFKIDPQFDLIICLSDINSDVQAEKCILPDKMPFKPDVVRLEGDILIADIKNVFQELILRYQAWGWFVCSISDIRESSRKEFKQLFLQFDLSEARKAFFESASVNKAFLKIAKHNIEVLRSLVFLSKGFGSNANTSVYENLLAKVDS